MTIDPDSDRLWPQTADPQNDILEYPALLLSALVQSCEDAIISKNLKGIVTSWNPAAVRLLGYTAEEMVGQPILRIIPPELHGEEAEILRRVGAGERIERYETERVAKDGRKLEVSLTISPIFDYLDKVVGASKIMREISLQKRTHELQSRLAAIVDSSNDAIIGKNTDGIITSWNAAASALFGYKPDEMIGQSNLRLIPKELHAEEEEILQKLKSGLRIEHFRTKRIRKNGEIIDISLTISPIKDSNGRVIGSSKIARDISLEKGREERLNYLSSHDQLTGLLNRYLLYDRLEMMLAQAKRNNTQCAVLALDIDHFKYVNDHHGHHAGDELLIKVAARLKSSLRAADTVSRMGGDEFTILISELHGPQDALLVAEKLMRQLRKPYVLSSDTIITITVSIGICMHSEDAQDGESLLLRSDTALYWSKSSGGDQVQFFSEEFAHQQFRRGEIVTALREALRAEKFSVEYQPIVDLRTGSNLGVECLLRLENGHMGKVAPSEFIPIAEETGLIEPIGAWVLEKACQTISALNRELNSELFVSVNFSPKQLQQPELLRTIERVLITNDLKPARLEVEITEGVLMQDSPQIVQFLEGLRRVGVRISIDDFGTGFSNISYLWHFSVDRLKLDRSMIKGLGSYAGSAVVTKALIALAHQLGISVIAEGVETIEQAEILKSADCDLAQGYFFSRPEPIGVIKNYLTRSKEIGDGG